MNPRFAPSLCAARFFFAVAALSVLAACPARAQEPENPNDPTVGVLKNSKTYRTVGEHKIKGVDIGKVLVVQGDRWQRGVEEFVKEVLVRESMDRAGLLITEQEIDAHLTDMAKKYAAHHPEVQASVFKPEQLADSLGVQFDFLREQLRTTMGLKKVLVKQKRLKPEINVMHPLAKQEMEKYLKELVDARNVKVEPNGAGVEPAVTIDGRPFGRDEVRARVLKELGPLRKSEVLNALEVLSLDYVVSRELEEKHSKTELTPDDIKFYRSYQARKLEAQKGLPDGGGLEALIFSLRQKGMSLEAFQRQPRFLIDAKIIYMARQQVTKSDLKAEWDQNRKLYERTEKKLAHIFKRVRDPQGRPYTPNWKAGQHGRVNEYIERIREERFAAVKQDLMALIGPAKADFAAVAEKFSDDKGTTGKLDEGSVRGGVIGRVSPNVILPPPFHESLITPALKLEPGQLSEPMRSPYGWHLVKCLEDQSTHFNERVVQERIYLKLLEAKHREILTRLSNSAEVKDLF